MRDGMVSSRSLLKSLFFISLLLGVIFAADCDKGEIPNPNGPGCIDAGTPTDPGNPGGSTPGGTGDMLMDSVKIKAALFGLCETVKGLLGVAMMLMVVSAAIVYSIGQVMGAETRARAAVWATSMFNGAIIAALIYLIVPWMLNQMVDLDIKC